MRRPIAHQQPATIGADLKAGLARLANPRHRVGEQEIEPVGLNLELTILDDVIGFRGKAKEPLVGDFLPEGAEHIDGLHKWSVVATPP